MTSTHRSALLWNCQLLPFLGMVFRKDSQNIMTSVCVKPANTGLLLHYNSDVDNRYKKSLIIITMVDRAFKLSSNWSLFYEECICLKTFYSYSWHILNTFSILSSPILLHPNKHLHANLHLTCNQYESFYHSRNKNQLTLCTNS